MVFCGFEKAWFIVVLHKTCLCQSVTCNLATLALIHLQQVQPRRHIVAQRWGQLKVSHQFTLRIKVREQSAGAYAGSFQTLRFIHAEFTVIRLTQFTSFTQVQVQAAEQHRARTEPRVTVYGSMERVSSSCHGLIIRKGIHLEPHTLIPHNLKKSKPRLNTSWASMHAFSLITFCTQQQAQHKRWVICNIGAFVWVDKK